MKDRIAKKIKDHHFLKRCQKISLVAFITILIWVWADLSLDVSYRDSTASITIAHYVDPSVWVRFKDGASQLQIKNIKFEGPVLRIAELKRKLEEGTYKLRFTLDPGKENLNEPRDGDYNRSLLPFLQSISELREMGLKVTECTPDFFDIKVSKLEKKKLTVRCLDNTTIITDAQIKPAQIEMFVPTKWQGQKLVADVELTKAEIAKARTVKIEKIPFVEFTPGFTSQSDTPVAIKLLATGSNRKDKTVQGSIGFVMTKELQDKYTVEMDNTSAFTTIQIQATQKAIDAYENQFYKILVDIKPEHIKGDPATAITYYNFPQEYIATDEIKARNKPQTVRFRLIPRTPNP